ncbi:MAG TPA: CAP domain-containing protein [Rudaea sp.]|nr:CAP domain-containing protein [Rudaea sp.]
MLLVLLPAAAADVAFAQALNADLAPAPVFPAGREIQFQAQSAQPVTPATITVDPTNRAAVAALYLHTYVPENAVTNGWSGTVSPCNPGSTSQAYQNATLERVNVFRALAGLPGNITAFSSSTDQTNDQNAALMMAANRQLNHDPPGTWTCYTTAGHTGAGSSNLTLGQNFNYNGPAAIEGYMDDGGSNNTAAGHRRWILYPPQAQMATGDVDATTATAGYSANALWVFGPFGTRPSTPNGIAWPPRGYVPWQLLPSGSNRWSLSIENADFTHASVSMTRNGVALPAPTLDALQFDGQPSGSFIGDNTLVWEPTGVAYTQPASDTTYHVTVSGIAGSGVPTSVSYDVIVFDPNTSDDIFADKFGG